MRFIDYIFTALRNISRQKLRTFLTVFAIVIGATSVTIMLALVTGAKGFFFSQFESTGQLEQVVVTKQVDLSYERARNQGGGPSDSTGVKLTDALAQKILAIPHVVGLSKTASPHVFDALIYKDKKLVIESVDGYDPNGVVTQDMLAGRDFQPSDGKGVVLISKTYADGLGFLNNYDALVGQTVTLQTQNFFSGEGADIQMPNMGSNQGPGSGPQPPQSKPTLLPAIVLGITSENQPAVHLTLAWSRGLLLNQRYDMTDADRQAMQAAQQAQQRAMQGQPFNGQPPPQIQPHYTLVSDSQIDQNGYDNYVVKVDQATNATVVASQIKALGVGAASAQDFIQQQVQIFNIVSYVLGGIGGIALLVAAIGVVNTMVMAILERTREIGVMRAVGAKRATVSRLFTFEASLLGFWGGIFGVLGGYGLTKLANLLLNKQLSSNGIKITDIIHLPLWLILSVVGTTTLIGMLAGLYPAHRAARLNPVDALRYE